MNKPIRRFRLTEIIIIFVLLSVAVLSLHLFRQDLMQTIRMQNEEPAGYVIAKKNTVQRRLNSRVLWDRLDNESPIYLWDIIRLANFSNAIINLQNNSIDLNENTMI